MSKTNYLMEEEENFGGEDESLDDLDIRQNRNQAKPSLDNHGSGAFKKNNSSDDAVVIAKSKLVLVSALLDTIRESQEKINQLLSGSFDNYDESRISIGQSGEPLEKNRNTGEKEGGRIIEGVFDGENMIGPDGKQYSVPANYASKSKLVEGDILKLTITSKGTFLYKQIGPIERTRVVGDLHQLENGSFIVISGQKEWKVLTASVTYYKGSDGDEIVILVPKIGDSKWAAVENIVRKTV